VRLPGSRSSLHPARRLLLLLHPPPPEIYTLSLHDAIPIWTGGTSDPVGVNFHLSLRFTRSVKYLPSAIPSESKPGQMLAELAGTFISIMILSYYYFNIISYCLFIISQLNRIDGDAVDSPFLILQP